MIDQFINKFLIKPQILFSRRIISNLVSDLQTKVSKTSIAVNIINNKLILRPKQQRQMSKKFLTGENGNKKNNKKSNQVQNTKITGFFTLQSIVRSTSISSFKTQEVEQELKVNQEKHQSNYEYQYYNKYKNEEQNEGQVNNRQMVEENEEYSSNFEKYSVLENSNGIKISNPSERQQERDDIRQQIQILDQLDTETDFSSDEEFNEQQEIARNLKMIREAKMKLENVYQLPYYFDKQWILKEQILKDIADKKYIKRHEFYTQITQLIRQSNERINEVNLDVLKQFVQIYLKDKINDFFENLVPFIAKLALEITQIDDVPILVQNEEGKITLTKRQVASFLANMFFCTLTTQKSRNIPYGNSFKAFYSSSLNYNQNDRKIEKIICIYNYFQSVKNAIENRQGEYEKQKVTYQRLVFDPNIHSNSNVSLFWKQNQTPLSKVTHDPKGLIEDFEYTIHVDFANALIGGGVLDHGLVQEEIRFLISPELIISRLFCPKMEDNEAIVILGSEQYTTYTGYGDTFHCQGSKDQSHIKLDENDRKMTAVVAIDAIHYGQSYDQNIQYRMQTIVREILKAYIGFHGGSEINQIEANVQIQDKYKISTGRWGCGIFMGDPHLKFLIQWIAASQAQREMIFCSFQDKELTDLDNIINILNDKTIGDIITMIHKYTEYFTKKITARLSLFQYCQIYYEAKEKIQNEKVQNQQMDKI